MQNNKTETRRAKIYRLLSPPYIAVLTMIMGVVFSAIDRNFNFFTGLGVASLLLWASHFKWSEFGFAKKITTKTILQSLGLTLLLLIGFGILEPILEFYFGKIDLSSVDDIRHNVVGYVVLLFIVWTFAAFGEEFIYRGYYMKRLATLFGNNNTAWLLSALIISIYFGVSHAYQGTTGIISVMLWHFCISVIFFKNRDNLISPVLIHGFYDTIVVTLIFMDKERVLSDWILEVLSLS